MKKITFVDLINVIREVMKLSSPREKDIKCMEFVISKSSLEYTQEQHKIIIDWIEVYHWSSQELKEKKEEETRRKNKMIELKNIKSSIDKTFQTIYEKMLNPDNEEINLTYDPNYTDSKESSVEVMDIVHYFKGIKMHWDRAFNE